MTTAFAFDLDGTLTCEELLPVIAEELSLGREMATLTRLTLSGAIEFEESFRLRCAILRAVPISRVRAIVAEVALAPAMEGFIRRRPSECFIVTGNLDVWVRPIIDRLGESLHEACSLGILDGDEIVYLARSASSRIMSPALNVGRRLPAYCTSIGHVMLAHLPPPERTSLP